jgi:hypothetical protein
VKATMSKYEENQPWVVYHYGLTHDKWWPFWNSTRILGRGRIVMQCAVCGAEEIVSLKMPRFGPVPDQGKHPARVRFLLEHAHPDRGAPMSWVRPLLNPAAMPDGIDLSALAMRLEADMLGDEDS